MYVYQSRLGLPTLKLSASPPRIFRAVQAVFNKDRRRSAPCRALPDLYSACATNRTAEKRPARQPNQPATRSPLPATRFSADPSGLRRAHDQEVLGPRPQRSLRATHHPKPRPDLGKVSGPRHDPEPVVTARRVALKPQLVRRVHLVDIRPPWRIRLGNVVLRHNPSLGTHDRRRRRRVRPLKPLRDRRLRELRVVKVDREIQGPRKPLAHRCSGSRPKTMNPRIKTIRSTTKIRKARICTTRTNAHKPYPTYSGLAPATRL